MMASSSNIELEAATFLHKLIQDSKDEPAKLAKKLYMILQHMKDSEKENSMPYLVISRAMETVVNQNGLDIEALTSSRLPLTDGNQVGDLTGSSQAGGVAKDSRTSLAEQETRKIGVFASSGQLGGPSAASQNLYRGSGTHRSNWIVEHESPSSLGSKSANSQSQENGEILNQMDIKSSTKRKRGESSYSSEPHSDNSLQLDTKESVVNHQKGKVSKVEMPGNLLGRVAEHASFCMVQSSDQMEHFPFLPGNIKSTNFSNPTLKAADPSKQQSASLSDGGVFGNVYGVLPTDAYKTVQKSEMTTIKPPAPRDPGKFAVLEGSPSSSSPFKDQQLKQLRAQCLVFLAFRNGLMPKKLHLEIALGNIIPKDDGSRRELVDHKGKIQSSSESGSNPGSASFGKLDYSGCMSAGKLSEVDFSLQDAEKSSTMVKNFSRPAFASGQELPASRILESQMQNQAICADDEQASSSVVVNKPMNPETIGWTGVGNLNNLSSSSFVQHELVTEKKDGESTDIHGISKSYVIEKRNTDSSAPLSKGENWKPASGNSGLSDAQRRDGSYMGNVNLSNGGSNILSCLGAQEEDKLGSIRVPPSPKYTLIEKWIMDQQKQKLLVDRSWAIKQQKSDQRISARFNELKKSVSSSEDISLKTKSVIELKKLQLLSLQRRLRSEFLTDFFKPIAYEVEHIKSYKKHKHGRRVKQLEKYEQKMKEERQKRIRERQKDFFSEIEVHKERLDDTSKTRRERWKSFNRCVKDFHKRKERIHREKIDKIQREKINLLKINDVEGYLRMVQDAKSDRVKQLLKETEKYLQKLGSRLRDAKVMASRCENDIEDAVNTNVFDDEASIENEDEGDQAKHFLESNEKYYMMAHSVKESITEQPDCLKGGKLREYQMNGLRWLVSLYNNHLNGILADEMGLGKTVQVISLICYLMESKNDRGPFLVVVPSSVLPGWESEINFWAPGIHKIVYSGPPEERRKLFKEQIVHQKFNVLLTTYEYLMNKHDRPKLSKIHWHYIVIDEGHRIKNASCKLNAELKHYKSSHRLLLTGTPLQNNLEELWALLNFLLPNIFNSSDDFSQWFNKPFESNGDSSAEEALLSEEENLLIINRLHQVLRPYVLRRLKQKVENELPDKIERLVRCEASAYQKLLMKRVEENLGAIGNVKARSVHNSVMELRNICNHPYLSQLHAEEVNNLMPKHFLPPIIRLCGKLEMLDRLLPKLKATDHRVLFFSTMTRLLDVMEDYLTFKGYKYLRLDGHTSGCDRGALIHTFNQPNSPFFIFLLSIRAGGVGVNLQAADTVILFDTDWNPQVDLQAQARAHRIGQKKDVLVLRFETVHTVEEQVRAAAEHKLGVANQSITAGFFDNNTSAEDRREYLESLLRESKKEEATPVLNDDALNDLIARSESEIDVFESVDKERREKEMEAWKTVILGQVPSTSSTLNSLPSRLVTDDDLKAFCQTMKLNDAPKTLAASNISVKRKDGRHLGSFDTQQYGRGKRAREVRSYEEQWSEEEFETICQTDSPDSPKAEGDGNLKNLLADVTDSVSMAGSGNTTLAAPIPLTPPIQLVEPPQKSKEATAPVKRGRGRPRRTDKLPSLSAPSALQTAPELKSSAIILPDPAMHENKNETISHSSLAASSSLEGISTESAPPGFPSVPVSRSVLMPPRARGRGRSRGRGGGRAKKLDSMPHASLCVRAAELMRNEKLAVETVDPIQLSVSRPAESVAEIHHSVTESSLSSQPVLPTSSMTVVAQSSPSLTSVQDRPGASPCGGNKQAQVSPVVPDAPPGFDSISHLQPVDLSKSSITVVEGKPKDNSSVTKNWLDQGQGIASGQTQKAASLANDVSSENSSFKAPAEMVKNQNSEDKTHANLATVPSDISHLPGSFVEVPQSIAGPPGSTSVKKQGRKVPSGAEPPKRRGRKPCQVLPPEYGSSGKDLKSKPQEDSFGNKQESVAPEQSHIAPEAPSSVSLVSPNLKRSEASGVSSVSRVQAPDVNDVARVMKQIFSDASTSIPNVSSSLSMEADIVKIDKAMEKVSFGEPKLGTVPSATKITVEKLITETSDEVDENAKVSLQVEVSGSHIPDNKPESETTTCSKSLMDDEMVEANTEAGLTKSAKAHDVDDVDNSPKSSVSASDPSLPTSVPSNHAELHKTFLILVETAQTESASGSSPQPSSKESPRHPPQAVNDHEDTENPADSEETPSRKVASVSYEAEFPGKSSSIKIDDHFRKTETSPPCAFVSEGEIISTKFDGVNDCAGSDALMSENSDKLLTDTLRVNATISGDKVGNEPTSSEVKVPQGFLQSIPSSSADDQPLTRSPCNLAKLHGNETESLNSSIVVNNAKDDTFSNRQMKMSVVSRSPDHSGPINSGEDNTSGHCTNNEDAVEQAALVHVDGSLIISAPLDYRNLEVLVAPIPEVTKQAFSDAKNSEVPSLCSKGEWQPAESFKVEHVTRGEVLPEVDSSRHVDTSNKDDSAEEKQSSSVEVVAELNEREDFPIEQSETDPPQVKNRETDHLVGSTGANPSGYEGHPPIRDGSSGSVNQEFVKDSGEGQRGENSKDEGGNLDARSREHQTSAPTTNELPNVQANQRDDSGTVQQPGIENIDGNFVSRIQKDYGSPLEFGVKDPVRSPSMKDADDHVTGLAIIPSLLQMEVANHSEVPVNETIEMDVELATLSPKVPEDSLPHATSPMIEDDRAHDSPDGRLDSCQIAVSEPTFESLDEVQQILETLGESHDQENVRQADMIQTGQQVVDCSAGYLPSDLLPKEEPRNTDSGINDETDEMQIDTDIHIIEPGKIDQASSSFQAEEEKVNKLSGNCLTYGSGVEESKGLETELGEVVAAVPEGTSANLAIESATVAEKETKDSEMVEESRDYDLEKGVEIHQNDMSEKPSDCGKEESKDSETGKCNQIESSEKTGESGVCEMEESEYHETEKNETRETDVSETATPKQEEDKTEISKEVKNVKVGNLLEAVDVPQLSASLVEETTEMANRSEGQVAENISSLVIPEVSKASETAAIADQITENVTSKESETAAIADQITENVTGNLTVGLSSSLGELKMDENLTDESKESEIQKTKTEEPWKENVDYSSKESDESKGLETEIRN